MSEAPDVHYYDTPLYAESDASPAATETTHSPTPRTSVLALNLKLQHDGASAAQAMRAFHALTEAP